MCFARAAHARGGFHQQKLGGAIELLPHFGELARQQTAKDRMHVGTGVVIGEARGFRLAVVTVNRMVKALPHVLGKGDGAKAADAFGEKRGKRGHAETAPVESSLRRVSQADWKTSRARASKRTK